MKIKTMFTMTPSELIVALSTGNELSGIHGRSNLAIIILRGSVRCIAQRLCALYGDS
jgi:hypothetical protein